MCRDEEPDVDPSGEEEYLNYMHEQENPDIDDDYYPDDDDYYPDDDDYYPDDEDPDDDDEDPDLEDQFWEAMDKDD